MRTPSAGRYCADERIPEQVLLAKSAGRLLLSPEARPLQTPPTTTSATQLQARQPTTPSAFTPKIARPCRAAIAARHCTELGLWPHAHLGNPRRAAALQSSAEQTTPPPPHRSCFLGCHRPPPESRTAPLHASTPRDRQASTAPTRSPLRRSSPAPDAKLATTGNKISALVQYVHYQSTANLNNAVSRGEEQQSTGRTATGTTSQQDRHTFTQQYSNTYTHAPLSTVGRPHAHIHTHCHTPAYKPCFSRRADNYPPCPRLLDATTTDDV